MAVLRDRPYKSFNFVVDLGGGNPEVGPLAFTEVVLPESALDLIEHRAGDAKVLDPLHLTGLEHTTNLILRRGVCGSLDLYQWYNDARNGAPNVERTVRVTLLDEERAPVLTWKFDYARPVRYSFDPLNALGREVLYETLELAFERMEME